MASSEGLVKQLALLLVLLVACGERTPMATRTPPPVRVVGCSGALPLPLADVAVRRPVRSGPPFRKTSTGTKAGPKVTLGSIVVSGTLKSSRAAPVVRRKLGELSACYARDPAVTKAVVQFRLGIKETGTVVSVDGSTAALGARLDACVRGVLRGLKFPSPPGGMAVTATVPLIFDATGKGEDGDVLAEIDEPWTPFARDIAVPGPAAAGAARVVEAALHKRVAAISECFGTGGPTGSLRVMLEIGLGGDVGLVRSGGLGDVKGEACVSKLVGELAVVTPIDEHVEVACDLARGDARPWRLALESYGVIEVERTQLRHGTTTLAPGGGDPDPLPPNTYVVVASPDTPGGMLQLAMMWAGDAHAILLGVRDGAGPPVFLGIADTSATESDAGVRASLQLSKTGITGCVGGFTEDAKLDGIGPLVQTLAGKCRASRCNPGLYVAIDSDLTAKHLVEIASATRRAGFARVMISSGEVNCTPAPKPEKKPKRPVIDLDLD